MAEKNSRFQDPQETGSSQATTSFLDVAWAGATPRLYRENPFRILGLPALASPRDVTKRVDELLLAQELGLDSNNWAFAPDPVPNQDKLRAASQLLKDPRPRLIAELFWFWPETYPVAGEDKAIDHLARGESAEAVAEWAALRSAEHPAALHNLAVYHHLMAIEQEQVQPRLPEEDVAAWWRASLRYWQVMVGTDEVWQRIEQRVAAMADAQLPPEIVAPLRKNFLDLISGVNSSLALRFAELGDHEAAARHVVMLGEIQADASDVRRVLERGAAPVVQRIDVRIAECLRILAADPLAGLSAAKALIEHSVADIGVLNTLCGRESEFVAEICTRLGSAAIDAVVGFQRETSDNTACLPILIYLQTLPLTPEAARRLRNSFEVIYANAATAQEEKHDGSELDEGPEPLYARSYRVVADHLIPALDKLELGELARRECADRLADLLRRVALGATDERDDINFALHAYQTLLQLPSVPGETARREAERDQFHQQFLLRTKKEVRLQLPGHVLEITLRGVRWDEEVLAFDEFTAFRHGKTTVNVDGAEVENYIVAWRTASGEVTLDRAEAFADPATAAADYAKTVEAFEFFVTPKLVEQLVQTIQKGDTVWVGKTAMTKAGMTLSTGSRLWKKEEELPYTKIVHRIENDAWVVASADNPRIHERYPILDTWNAALMGYVVDALAKK